MSGFRDKSGGAPHYVEHRERMRRRFREAGPENLQDYELLEVLLFQALPRIDTKPIAKDLLRRFGSFGGVLAAPDARLKEVDGVGDSVVHLLKVVQECAKRYLKEPMKQADILDSWSSVIDYCRGVMAYETVEQFRILFLDKRNQLIADEVQQSGTVDHTPVYPREVVKRALELSATAVILVHNHPSGDPTPSRADVQMTRAVIDIAKPLGITVHDHIIVGRQGHASFKGLKLI